LAEWAIELRAALKLANSDKKALLKWGGRTRKMKDFFIYFLAAYVGNLKAHAV
jgi:hypothetical protein